MLSCTAYRFTSSNLGLHVDFGSRHFRSRRIFGSHFNSRCCAVPRIVLIMRTIVPIWDYTWISAVNTSVVKMCLDTDRESVKDSAIIISKYLFQVNSCSVVEYMCARAVHRSTCVSVYKP